MLDQSQEQLFHQPPVFSMKDGEQYDASLVQAQALIQFLAAQITMPDFVHERVRQFGQLTSVTVHLPLKKSLLR